MEKEYLVIDDNALGKHHVRLVKESELSNSDMNLLVVQFIKTYNNLPIKCKIKFKDLINKKDADK